MAVDEKAVLHRLVRCYIAEQCPGDLAEFDAVFPTVYDATAGTESEAAGSRRGGDSDEIAFDAGVAQATIISVSCVVGLALLRAALKDAANRDLPAVLDRVEIAIVRRIGRKRLVHELRVRVQGIVQEL
jgi:hypothetical protein